jgi:hypothetical protein
MTDKTPHLTAGDEYLVFYQAGPYDGQIGTLISTDGSWEKEVTVLAAVDGHEQQFVYSEVSVGEVGGKLQVTYRWDSADSDTYEAPEERGEL